MIHNSNIFVNINRKNSTVPINDEMWDNFRFDKFIALGA
jgi:hypothetical protein